MTQTEVKRIVQETISGFRRAECGTCECFQGFLVQLELDAAENVSDIVSLHKVSIDWMHGCLGCDPCPPGVSFAAYLRDVRKTGAEHGTADPHR